jgi:stage III sporulation protein AA
MEDMKQKPLLNRLVESHVFERYIVLDAKPHAGSVQAIFDGRGTTLYRREAFL